MENNVSNKLKKINIRGEIKEQIPMKMHTTFKTGGIADFFAVPENYQDIIKIIKFTRLNSIPYFILGGGANILVSDRGIRGIVIDMKNISNFCFNNEVCSAGSGVKISDLSKAAAENKLQGLDFIYGMPGSVGGAVWMNARCYDASISDILISVDYLDKDLNIKTLKGSELTDNFAYKYSPFQNSRDIILSADFKLKKGNIENIWDKMDKHKIDRERKGHYKFPCAGSVFKNNRTFGKPTGVIIDSLGLKGYRRGEAQIADFHGNIIINRGDARSEDIRDIIEYTQKTVDKKLGLELETEIQLIGDWG